MTVGTSKAGLEWYLDHIKTTTLLTAQEEQQLARRIREHSDPIAREQMIQANLRLVVKIAKEYSNPGMTLSDLIAEGNLGLMRAVEDFNPDAGVRFSTYAAWWIKQSIKKALINSGQAVHIPAYLAKLITKWRRTSSKLENNLGRAPTQQEMAASLGISQKKAEIIADGLQAVNAPNQSGGEDNNAISEMLADHTEDSPDQALMDAAKGPEVQKLLAKLDQRQRKILEMRFGLDGYQGPPRTFKQIGEVIGLTRERVRQLEKEALASLRKAIE
jgi:RNA polymerase primary sigma factor